MTPAMKEELLLTYAAFILKDAEAAMTADNINKLIKSAGGKVDPVLPKLYAKTLEGKDLGDYIKAAGTPGAGGGAAAAAGGAAPAAEEAKKEEVVEEEEEEMD